MTDIFKQVADRLEKNEDVVLATILTTKGSSPQVPGAMAVFTKEGLATGTLGGGQLEAAAQKASLKCLKNKSSILKKFRMYGGELSEEQALCGGEALILLDGAPENHLAVFEEILASLAEHHPGVLLTSIDKTGPDAVIIKRKWSDSKEVHSSEKPVLKENGDTLLFQEPLFPKYKLIIAGAGHVGQATAHLGSLLDFEVIVIDDREEFANRKRFPDSDSIVVRNIGEAIRNISIDKNCFIVIVTRGHSHDANVLRECIHSEAAYIGMIGSANKIAVMRKTFLEKRWATETQWERIFAPIGLDIRSTTIQEIAVSIAAQLIQIRNGLHPSKE